MNGTGPGSPPAPRRPGSLPGGQSSPSAATWGTGWPPCKGASTRCSAARLGRARLAWPGSSGLGSSGLGSSGLALVALSPVYETVPVGGPPQPEYLNAVLIAETTLPATALLRRVQAVEAAFGRVRQEVWGPRTLDVDVIVYGDVVSDDPELMLPHPRAWERAFVLAPWLDADPDAEIPGQGRVAGLLEAAVARNGGQPGVRRLADVQLRPPA